MDFIVNNIGNIVIIAIVLLICGLSLANIIKKEDRAYSYLRMWMWMWRNKA